MRHMRVFLEGVLRQLEMEVKHNSDNNDNNWRGKPKVKEEQWIKTYFQVCFFKIYWKHLPFSIINLSIFHVFLMFVRIFFAYNSRIWKNETCTCDHVRKTAGGNLGLLKKNLQVAWYLYIGDNDWRRSLKWRKMQE